MNADAYENRCFDMTGSWKPREAAALLARRVCRLLRALDAGTGWRDDGRWDDAAMADWFNFPTGWAYRSAIEALMSMGYVQLRGGRRLCLADGGTTFSDQLGENSMLRQTGRGQPGDSVAFLASVLLE